MKRSRAGRGFATRRLTWFAIPMLVLAAFAGPASVAANNAGQCAGFLDAGNTKVDTSNDGLVLQAGLTICIHASNGNTGQLTTDGTSTLHDYIVASGLLNNGDQVPQVSNYVVYGVARTPTPSQSTEPSGSVEPTQSTEPTPSQSTEPSQSTNPCVPPPGSNEPLPEDCPVITPHFSALGTTPFCDGDVPWLDYQVAVDNSPNTTVTITFLHPTDASKNVVYANLPLTGTVLWPGAVVDGLGNPVDWPGWTWDGTKWVAGDEWDWTRPSVKVRFEGNVNASAEVTVAYPPSSPNCSANPPGDVLAETSGPNTPHTPTLPPTDTLGSTQTTTGSSWGLVLLLMASLSAGILFLSPARILRKGRRD